MPIIYPEYPFQILPRLSMPNFTEIIHAKIYPDHHCEILPRLSMPNFTYIIHAKFEISYSNKPRYLLFPIPCTYICRFSLCTCVQFVQPPVACSSPHTSRWNTRVVKQSLARKTRYLNCTVPLHREHLTVKILQFVVIILRPVTRRI